MLSFLFASETHPEITASVHMRVCACGKEKREKALHRVFPIAIGNQNAKCSRTWNIYRSLIFIQACTESKICWHVVAILLIGLPHQQTQSSSSTLG